MPPRCVACGSEGAWWCHACAGSVKVADLRYPAHGMEGVRAAAFYNDPLASALKALKYRHAKVVAPSLADYLVPLVPPKDPVLIPVPLHPKRLRSRGHNQAELLAQSLARLASCQISDGLIRVRHTATQTKLNKAERARNVADAFTWRGGSLRGKTVVLIDDVTTTGATFAACADALNEARPRSIWGLAVAKKR